MERTAFFEALAVALSANGLPQATDEQAEQFYLLSLELCAANETMNLTAITDMRQMIVRHLCDCAFAAGTDIFPENSTVADIGAGAGFPTLPLAILRPDLHIMAVDSTEKRMMYVARTAKKLGLSNVTTLAARAETLGHEDAYREQFDCVSARAVARLNVLCEWCLPLVKTGGRFVAMKAKRGAEELTGAQNALRLLHTQVIAEQKPLLTDPFAESDSPDKTQSRHIIVMKKNAPTDKKYPRANGQIMKKPL